MKDIRRGKASASRMAQIKQCPQSMRAQEGLPEVQSDVATFGTRCHAALETGRLDNLTTEQVEAVTLAREIEAGIVSQWVEEFGIESELEETREARLWGFDDRLSGQNDRTLESQRNALVIDYKFGHGDVDPPSRNIQLRALACLLKESNPALRSISVAIVQPYGPRYDFATYLEPDLIKAREEITHILNESQRPDAERRPSTKACEYCKAKPTCPEAQEVAISIARMAPESLTADNLPAMLDLAKAAEKAFAARVDMIRAKARELLQDDPNALAGWELKDGRTMRSVSDAQALFDELRERDLIDVKGMMRSVKVSVPSIENEVAVFSGTSKKDAKQLVADFCADHIETKQGAPMLAKKK